MKHSYTYEFKRIILEPLEEKDIESLRLLRNRERRYFINQDEITKENQVNWYKRYLEKDNDIMFRVVQKCKPDIFVGAIALYDIDWEKKTCEFGRTLIDREIVKEKGLGFEATVGVTQFGFDILNLNKIVAEVLKTNERVLKIYKRAGYSIMEEKGELYKLEIKPGEVFRDSDNSVD